MTGIAQKLALKTHFIFNVHLQDYGKRTFNIFIWSPVISCFSWICFQTNIEIYQLYSCLASSMRKKYDYSTYKEKNWTQSEYALQTLKSPD